MNTSFKDVNGTNDTHIETHAIRFAQKSPMTPENKSTRTKSTRAKNNYAKISQNLYILSHAKSTNFIMGKVVTFPDLVKQF